MDDTGTATTTPSLELVGWRDPGVITAATFAAAAGFGSVAGLAVFGILTDATGTFRAAAITICLPAILLAGAYFWLPETRGRELEQTAPEPQRPPDAGHGS